MFVNRIYRHARDNPDSLAVVDNGNAVTYRDFARLIHLLRSYLMKSQLPPKSLVVNLSSNLYFDWALLLALWSLGHTTVSSADYGTIGNLRLRGIAALVCSAGHTDAIEAFARARPDCPIVKIPPKLTTDLGTGALPEPIEGGWFGDHILYSSGTTGTYKKLRYNSSVTKSVF